MKEVGTADLKAHLSAHLRRVRSGESITVLDRRQPIARILPVSDVGAELVVRPAQGNLQDIEIPPPVAATEDVLEDLERERAERW